MLAMPNVQIFSIKSAMFEGINETLAGNNSQLSNTIFIPANVSANVTGIATAVSVIRYSSDVLFPSVNQTMVSEIVSVVIEGIEAGRGLDNPVQFTFDLFPLTDTNGTLACVHWDFVHQLWMRSGCNTSMSTDTSVTCSCSHLTNFGILLDTTGASNSLSSSDQLALGLITYIGCSISIALLTLTTLTFLWFSVRFALI